jgi:hypothetical protein
LDLDSGFRILAQRRRVDATPARCVTPGTLHRCCCARWWPRVLGHRGASMRRVCGRSTMPVRHGLRVAMTSASSMLCARRSAHRACSARERRASASQPTARALRADDEHRRRALRADDVAAGSSASPCTRASTARKDGLYGGRRSVARPLAVQLTARGPRWSRCLLQPRRSAERTGGTERCRRSKMLLGW